MTDESHLPRPEPTEYRTALGTTPGLCHTMKHPEIKDDDDNDDDSLWSANISMLQQHAYYAQVTTVVPHNESPWN